MEFVGLNFYDCDLPIKFHFFPEDSHSTSLVQKGYK